MNVVIFGLTAVAAAADIYLRLRLLLQKQWCSNGVWAIAQFLMALGAFCYLLENNMAEKSIFLLYGILLIVCVAVVGLLKWKRICFVKIHGVKRRIGKAVCDIVERFRKQNKIAAENLFIYGDLAQNEAGILVLKDIQKPVQLQIQNKIQVFLDKYGYTIRVQCICLMLLDIGAVLITACLL